MLGLSLEFIVTSLIILGVFISLVMISECESVGRSLIAFILFTVLVAIIYLYIGAPIVAAFQIIIYSGAVVAFLLLALSMMREEVISAPKLSLSVVARFSIAFLSLILLLIFAYSLPMDILALPNVDFIRFVSGMKREHAVSYVMWGLRPLDVIVLGAFTLILAAGIRHFYREIMRRG